MSIDHRKVQRVARLISGGGPAVSQAQAAGVVRDLRRQAGVAPALVGEITGLDEAAADAGRIEVKVVDRPTWAAAAARSIDAMTSGLPAETGVPAETGATAETGVPAETGAPARSGTSIGTAEGAIVLPAVASRVLGQFDPFAGEGRLYLVAPNVASFRGKYDLDQRDLCLWVCVHELTHATQFAAAPWLKAVITDRASALFSAMDAGDSASEILAEATAMMSLLEGHAEYVMNNVPVVRMPSRARIVAAMARQRKAKNPLIAAIAKYTGFEEKTKQYTQGAQFVAHVVDAEGMEFFNRVWENVTCLPNADELADPDTWIERMR
ncbi:zinc-dependent metalloprotease [Trueperella pecoris]|uniref:Zinc-dependent metalloprotease n=1 Tax=Trueperella pecoris TaxID=2733571 RepID=A0A7M1QVZ9_9ACTO|nr:zinc-dependent metalloprotease [Trueperella pecoris]QOR46003.1 zinc-dependent metalloprotease [Trueperella pecoris]